MTDWAAMKDSGGEATSGWSSSGIKWDEEVAKDTNKDPNYADMEWKRVFRNSFLNIPKSAYNQVSSLASALWSPIQTSKAILSLAHGIAQKPTGEETPDTRLFDSVIEGMKERYGTIKGMKEAIATDPVGIATDISSAVLPAAKTVQGIGAISKVDKINKVAKIISKSAQNIEPYNVYKRLANLPFKAIPDYVPTRLYKSAVKFSTALDPVEQTRLAKIAVKNDIMPTMAGYMKARQSIKSLNDEIDLALETARGAGSSIPVVRLMDNLGTLYAQESLMGGKGIKTLDKIRDNIMSADNVIKRKGMMTPTEMQTFKKKLYKQTESYWAGFRNSSISIEAKQNIALTAKELLEEVVPEIKMLNAKEGELLALREAMRRGVNRIAQRDLGGIGIPIKTFAAASVGNTMDYGPQLAAVGLALGVLDTPTVKSKLALTLNKLKSKGVKINPTTTAIRLGLIQSGKLKKEWEGWSSDNAE